MIDNKIIRTVTNNAGLFRCTGTLESITVITPGQSGAKRKLAFSRDNIAPPSTDF